MTERLFKNKRCIYGYANFPGPSNLFVPGPKVAGFPHNRRFAIVATDLCDIHATFKPFKTKKLRYDVKVDRDAGLVSHYALKIKNCELEFNQSEILLKLKLSDWSNSNLQFAILNAQRVFHPYSVTFNDSVGIVTCRGAIFLPYKISIYQWQRYRHCHSLKSILQES